MSIRPGVLAAAGAALLASTIPAGAQERALRLVVHNDLDAARPRETVEVPAALFGPALGTQVLGKVRAYEEPSGQELLAQAVDLDGDLAAEQVVFQASFAPRQVRRFRLVLGPPRELRREDFEVYGRFVRERHDDFVWENDRVAFRVYGEALETWQREPLTSSAVDAWSKRTERLVANDWYLTDDYHRDHGEGGDFYPAGSSRGCGGSGLWRDGALLVSRNFRGSRVLAAGPLRLVFELDYPAWDTPGIRERKRVTLDAGSHFNLFESTYEVAGVAEVAWAAGAKVEKGALTRRDVERGFVRTWEHLTRYGENGWLGCAVVAEPGTGVEIAESGGNLLIVGRSAPGRPARYYTGTGWDRSGHFADVNAWDRQVEALSARLRSPLRVEADGAKESGR